MSYTPPNGDAVDFELASYTPPNGDAVDFELAVQDIPAFLLGFGMRGKLGNPSSPDPLNVMGIYQMRQTLTGKRPIKMAFYTPTNPQTTAQEANRAKFAAAMSAWGSLTESEKTAYNIRAKKRGLFGWNLFIRDYYQNN